MMALSPGPRRAQVPTVDQAATGALWDVVTATNGYVSTTRPWELAKEAARGDRRAAERLGPVLDALLEACGAITAELRPFLPVAAERIARALADLDAQQGRTLFAKLETP